MLKTRQNTAFIVHYSFTLNTNKNRKFSITSCQMPHNVNVNQQIIKLQIEFSLNLVSELPNDENNLSLCIKNTVMQKMSKQVSWSKFMSGHSNNKSFY